MKCEHDERVAISYPRRQTKTAYISRLDDHVEKNVSKQTHLNTSNDNALQIALETLQVDHTHSFAWDTARVAVLKQRGVCVKQVGVGIVPAQTH